MVTKKSRLWAFAATALLFTGLTSCLKNSNPEPPAARTFIAFVNGISAPYSADLYLNGTKINVNPMTLGYAVADYFKPAEYKFDFKKAGADSLLATTTARFDTNDVTTLIAYGDTADGAHMYKIMEDLQDLSTTKANVRFFNLMPGTDAYDVFVNGTKLFSSRYYEDFIGGGYTDFTPIEPGSINISIKDAGGNEIAAKSQVDLSSAGRVSTFYLIGTKGGTHENMKPTIKVVTY